MKKMITATLAAGLIAGVASAQTSVTLDFASAYVYRGATLLDGASFQPGIETSGFGLPEEYGSVTAGVWGSADLDDDNGTSSTFQETDYYASYTLPIEALDVSIGYTEYAYAAGSSDKEFSIGLGYELAGVGLSAAFYQGVGGGIGSSIYAEFGAGYDIEVSTNLVVSLGGRVAYSDHSDNEGYWGDTADESGFSDYDLTIGASYALSEKWSAGISGTYIGQIDDDVLADDDDGGAYDVDFVGMFSLACEM